MTIILLFSSFLSLSLSLSLSLMVSSHKTKERRQSSSFSSPSLRYMPKNMACNQSSPQLQNIGLTNKTKQQNKRKNSSLSSRSLSAIKGVDLKLFDLQMIIELKSNQYANINYLKSFRFSHISGEDSVPQVQAFSQMSLPQVESTAKKIQRGTNFSIQEDNLLVFAFLNVNQDVVQSTIGASRGGGGIPQPSGSGQRRKNGVATQIRSRTNKYSALHGMTDLLPEHVFRIQVWG